MATYWSQLYSANPQYEQWLSPVDNEGLGLSTVKYRQARITMTDAEAATVVGDDTVILMPVRLNERLIHAWAFTNGEAGGGGGWEGVGTPTFSIGFWRMGPNGTLGAEIDASTWSQFLVTNRVLDVQTRYYPDDVYGMWAFRSTRATEPPGGIGGETYMYGMRWYDMPGVAEGLAPVSQNSELLIVLKFDATPAPVLTAGGTIVFQYWYIDG